MAFHTGLLGKKLGITSIFTTTGDRTPVTAVHAGPCVVLDKMTPDKHGYAAVKLGFGEKPLRRTKKPELGLFTKANVPPQRFIREVRLEAADLDKFEVGKAVPLTTVFAPLSYIDVEGTSKGKGFQGVMKRHHMPGFRATHSTHEFFRHGGSIGCRLTPGKVHKGKRMGGHMGDVKKTVQNLVVLEVDDAQNLLLIRLDSWRPQRLRRRAQRQEEGRHEGQAQGSGRARGQVEEPDEGVEGRRYHQGGRRQAGEEVTSPLGSTVVQAPRPLPPTRRVPPTRQAARLRRALGLQARRNRPEAPSPAPGQPGARSRPPPRLVAPIRRRGGRSFGGWSASTAPISTSPSPTRASSSATSSTSRSRPSREISPPSTSSCRTWRRTPAACARSIRRVPKAC